MNGPLLLGFDIGSSSVKAALINASSGSLVAFAYSPEGEMKIDAPQLGHAEQHPEVWWENIVLATKTVLSRPGVNPMNIIAIGIAYQMHGLVMVNKAGRVIHPSIIWCDSRAVDVGHRALRELGPDYCMHHLLNSPGNFTASKLSWVKDNLPEVYSAIHRIMLPGDYIAFRMTNTVATTVPGLSEGMFWDFRSTSVADRLIEYFGLDRSLLPEVIPTFGHQGVLTENAGQELGLPAGIPVTYRAGDQPNNALSLNVMNSGEVAATAGTSGVIYGVTTRDVSDERSRVNTFAHVSYTKEHPLKGVLLCINGTGIQYQWLKRNILGQRSSYEELNARALGVEIGSDGLMCFPYGNGAERVLLNRTLGGRFHGINFNIHTVGHLVRAAQEGIAFSFRYGLDILKEMGLEITTLRVGSGNLFRSRVFQEAIVNACNVQLTICDTDGAQGAARGAGIGLGYYKTFKEAFIGLNIVEEQIPNEVLSARYQEHYGRWKEELLGILGQQHSPGSVPVANNIESSDA